MARTDFYADFVADSFDVSQVSTRQIPWRVFYYSGSYMSAGLVFISD